MPVYKDKKRGTWYFEFKKIIDGVSYRNKKRGFQSKSEALLAEQEAIENINSPKIQKEKYTIDDLFDLYCDYRKTNTKLTTLGTINKRYNKHIKDTFGNVKLINLNNKDIFKWKQQLIQYDFTEQYTNSVIGEFKRILQFGINKGYITNNTLLDEFEKIHMNKIVKERDVWTLDEINKFLDVFAKDDPTEYDYWLYFYAYSNTGMRPNEFRALQVKDIQDDYLVVNKTITSKLGGDDYLQSPKNVNSNRKVLMPHEIIELLLEHTKGYRPNDFIFGKEKAYRETNLNRKLRIHAKAAGLNPIVLYGFRHSHATNLIKAGIPIKVVSKRLGHKNASTTMNVYWHLFQEDESQVLNILKSSKK